MYITLNIVYNVWQLIMIRNYVQSLMWVFVLTLMLHSCTISLANINKFLDSIWMLSSTIIIYYNMKINVKWIPSLSLASKRYLVQIEIWAHYCQRTSFARSKFFFGRWQQCLWVSLLSCQINWNSCDSVNVL